MPDTNTISAYSTAFIAILTLAYVIVSWLMWKKLGEQADRAKASTDALIDIERPWIRVLIKRVDVPPLPRSPSQPFVNIWPQVESVGRTPARIRLVVFKKHILPKDSSLPQNVPPALPAKLDYSDGISADKHALIVPSDAIMPMPVEVTVEDWDAVKRRDVFLYVYGVVYYYGVGGEDHRTAFCNIYWVPYGKSDPQPEGFLTSANIPEGYTYSN